mgnify:CR=1 FL=1
MASDQKASSASTIPLAKLTVVMNNFIVNTITHMNKLSVKGDKKLSEFDKKLNDLDVMTALLEAKLKSLPEKITSTYPPLQEVNLDDVIPINIQNPVQVVDDSGQGSEVISGTGSGVPVPPPPPPPPIPEHPNPNQLNPIKEEPDKEKEGGDEEQKAQDDGGGNEEELSPEDALENFLKEHENFRNIYKMLKMGVPSMQVEMKAKMNGLDPELLSRLIEGAKKVNPNLK